MLSVTQILLIFVVSVLTVILAIIGIQVFLILKESRHSIEKVNKMLDDALINEAVKKLLEQGSFRTSPRRATSEYRKHIIAGLFRDTLNETWKRANIQ